MVDATLEMEIRNLLKYGDLPFSHFVELALYHPSLGYYSRAADPIGKEGDYTTAPQLSPVFGYAMGLLAEEFVGRTDDVPSSIVDIGCGDATLINSIASSFGRRKGVEYYGVDRSLTRARPREEVRLATSIEEIPPGMNLWISNELFDALPFTRLVQRGEHLQELWITDRNGELDWKEHEAAAPWDDYFAGRGIELSEGQFVDVSREWEDLYRELATRIGQGLLVTFDYGFPEKQLFDPRIRRFGTAASYRQQRVSRDLLSDPGERDLTAHVNFSDLIRAGEESGLTTLYFDRQAKFLLALGISGHELFAPVEEGDVRSVEEAMDLRQRREDARRLVLPEGIGEDIRVLVQGRKVPGEGWSFQRKLF